MSLTRRKKELRNLEPPYEPEQYPLRLDDGSLAQWLGIGGGLAGVPVNETSVLSLSAVFRSMQLLSGVVASLPLKSYRTLKDGSREEVPSFLDSPHPDMTQFEWIRLVVTHYVYRGNVYLLHIYSQADTLIGLQPIHPGAVTVEIDKDPKSRTYAQKLFKITINNEQRTYDGSQLTHIPGLSLDGIVGVDPINVLADTFGVALSAQQASARQLNNGAMIAGIVTAEEDVDEEEAKVIKAELSSRISGVKNVGDIAFVNRSLQFTPWMMTNRDAEFSATAHFEIDEIARVFGLPKVLLAEDGASTWGSGIAELIRGMQKFVLVPITTAIEQRLSGILVNKQHCEFVFDGLFQGTPSEVTDNLIKEVEAGLLTLDEARAIKNRPPLTPEEAPDGSEEI